MKTQLYTCDKVTEGGSISQKEAISHLKRVIRVKEVVKAHSPYIGQYGLEVTATENQHEKVEKYLFGF